MSTGGRTYPVVVVERDHGEETSDSIVPSDQQTPVWRNTEQSGNLINMCLYRQSWEALSLSLSLSLCLSLSLSTSLSHYLADKPGHAKAVLLCSADERKKKNDPLKTTTPSERQINTIEKLKGISWKSAGIVQKSPPPHTHTPMFSPVPEKDLESYSSDFFPPPPM